MSHLEVDFIVKGEAYFHSALDVIIVFAARLRTVKRNSRLLLAHDTALVRFLRLDSIQLYGSSGRQSNVVEPKGAREMNPPVERIARNSFKFLLILFFLSLAFFQWSHFAIEVIFFFLDVQCDNV